MHSALHILLEKEMNDNVTARLCVLYLDRMSSVLLKHNIFRGGIHGFTTVKSIIYAH
jgi:hypothetical protein